MIICFITPTGIIKVGSKAAEFIPVVGPAVEYTKKAQKITQLSDPVSASSRGIGMVFNYCFGKTAVVSTECILWFSCSVIGGVTGNPVLIALGAQMGNLVIDELID